MINAIKEKIKARGYVIEEVACDILPNPPKKGVSSIKAYYIKANRGKYIGGLNDFIFEIEYEDNHTELKAKDKVCDTLDEAIDRLIWFSW